MHTSIGNESWPNTGSCGKIHHNLKGKLMPQNNNNNNK